MGIYPSIIDGTVITHSCTEHRDSSAAETVVHKDSSHISNHNILTQIYAIDSVSDTLHNGNNFITVRDIREAEVTANDQFTGKEYEIIERNHLCCTIPSLHTEGLLFEVKQLHMNNNYKGEEFENNNDNEMDAIDNRTSFQTQNSVSFPLEHAKGKVTLFEHTVQVDLNKAGHGIPVNNNDLGVEVKDVGSLCGISRAPCVALESDGDNEKFEYSVMVKGESFKSSSNGEFGNTEVGRTGSCGGIDDVGTDSTDVINGSEIHFNSTSPSAASSCSDLNIDVTEPGANKDTGMFCGQIEHSDCHSRVTAFPIWHSCIQNIIPKTEGIIHNGRQTVGIYSVTNYNSSLNLDGHLQMVNYNFESHTNENKNVEGTEILQLDQETGKSCVKTGTVLKQSMVAIKSPIVDFSEYSSYGSTSEIKNASFDGGKFYCNGSDIKLTKPTKHKKKEPGIT
jgi:hypothetical protein